VRLSSGAAVTCGGRRLNGLTDAAALTVLTPLIIFVAEALVVTIATMRSIFVSRGIKAGSAALGLVEASIWLFAVGQVFQNLSNLNCSIAYAAGFTLGNYLGVLLEQKVAVGSVLLRVVTSRDSLTLVQEFTAAGFGVTRMDALGANGPVQVVLTVVKRKELARVVALVKGFDPGVFYSVDDLHSAGAGVFPPKRSRFPRLFKRNRAA
jgi:uncharacterized protein YebE (UPF0316 family)